jgi:hypothetical protein
MAMAIKPETPEVAEGRAAVEELPAAEVAYLTIRGPYTSLEDAGGHKPVVLFDL